MYILLPFEEGNSILNMIQGKLGLNFYEQISLFYVNNNYLRSYESFWHRNTYS